MADAVTLPSDLVIPELAGAYLGAEFVKSLAAWQNLMGPGDDMPIKSVNFGFQQRGGEYIQQPVFSQISGLVSRRDVTSAAAIDTLKIVAVNERGVILRGKIGPVSFTPDASGIAGIAPGSIEREIGNQGAAQLAEHVQSAILYALRSAIANMTTDAHTHSVWATGTRTNLSTALLAAGRAKMADRADKIKAWIMRSESHYDLFTNNLAYGVDNIAGVVARGGPLATLGLPYHVVDHAGLTAADSGYDKYYTIGIGAGAVEVEVQAIRFYPAQLILDKETVEIQVRGDFDFALRVKGMQYDSTNGGANPAVATTLATESNWDPVYGDHREVPAILIEHNYSGN
jgi:hypothetical protein